MSLLSCARSQGLWIPVIAVVTAFLVFTPPADAQPVPAGGSTLYRYAQPGQAVITVNMWGAIRQPGLYEVAAETDLYRILSLAGGPVFLAEDTREDRRVLLEVVRTVGSERSVVFMAPLDDLARPGAASPPVLQTGDVITVRTRVRPRFTWRDTLAVVGTAGSLVVVVLSVIDFSR